MRTLVLLIFILSAGLFSGCSTLQKGVAFYQAEWAKGETEFQRAAHNSYHSPRADQEVWMTNAYGGTRGAPPSIYDPPAR